MRDLQARSDPSWEDHRDPGGWGDAGAERPDGRYVGTAVRLLLTWPPPRNPLRRAGVVLDARKYVSSSAGE